MHSMTPILDDQLPDVWEYLDTNEDSIIYRRTDKEFEVVIQVEEMGGYNVAIDATTEHHILDGDEYVPLNTYHVDNELIAKATAVGYMHLADLFEQHYLEYGQ